jgi:hypothetical protein
MDIPPAATPVVCDMTTAPDTEDERIAEYRRLFGAALLGRDRTPEGIRFRFGAAPGVEAWVRDLAAREKACCAFFGFEISLRDNEVTWDLAVPDSDAARALLDEFYALPDTLADPAHDPREQFTRHGLTIISPDNAKPART